MLLFGGIFSSNGWFINLLMGRTTRFSETLNQQGQVTLEVIPLKELYLVYLGGTDRVHNMLGNLNSTLARLFTPWRLEMSPIRLIEHGQVLVVGTHPV